jgi:type I restriction enzyme, S subunit
MKKPEKQLLNMISKIDKSDWKSFKFDDIAFNISEHIEPSDTKAKIYVGLEHIDTDSIHIRRTGIPSDVEGIKLKVYKGDIIFGKRRAYQRKAAIANFDGICSAHSMVLRANPETIDPNLFPFFMHSDVFMNRAVDISEGSLSPTIKWKILSEQKFCLPPQLLQKKFAEILWAADELENKQFHLVEEKKIFKKVLMDKLFANKIKNNPKKWAKVKIGDVVTLAKNRSKAGEYPYIEIGDVDINSKEYSFKDKKSVIGSLFAKKNNIIISKVRPTRGAISIVKEDILVVSGAFSVLEIDDSKLDLNFLFLILYDNDQFFNYLGIRSTGTTYPTCSDNDILEFQIFLPPIDVQKELSDILFKHSNDIKRTLNMVELTKKLKFSIINNII